MTFIYHSNCYLIYDLHSKKVIFAQVIPISLNPGIKSLHMRHNALHTVDAALHFYTALQILDLSHNQVRRKFLQTIIIWLYVS
jgi:hypothetical protein